MKILHTAFVPIMFSHWVGWGVSLGYILCLVVMSILMSLAKGNLLFHKVFIGIIIFCFCFLIVNYSSFVFGANNSIVVFYLYQFLSLFLVVAIILLARPWKTDEIKDLARVIFWIAFYSIAIEFFVVNFLGISKEYMPGVRYSPSYFKDYLGWHRPFGLTGQSSANGGILMLTFLLMTEYRIANAKAFFALLVGGVLTISGQAVLSIFMVVGLLQLTKVRTWLNKALLSTIFLIAIALILYFEVFEKVSIEYLVYVLWEKAYFWETVKALGQWQLYFGSLGTATRDIEGSNEVYLIEFIWLFGIVFTVAFWAFVWFLVKNSRNRFVWFAGCFVASLHYPTVMYIEAQLPLALLYLSTLQRKRKNIILLKKTTPGNDDIENLYCVTH